MNSKTPNSTTKRTNGSGTGRRRGGNGPVVPKKKRGLASLVIVFGVLMAAAVIVARVLSPEQVAVTQLKPAATPTPAPQTETVSGTTEAAEPVVSNPAAAPKPAPVVHQQSLIDPPADMSLDDSNRDVLLACTKNVNVLRGVGNKNDFKDLREFISKGLVVPAGQKLNAEKEYENIHIQDANGKELRLHMAPSEDSESFALVPHFYSTDAENLPVPMAAPAEYRGLKTDEIAKRFEAKGKVIYRESSEVQSWGDDVSASITNTNGAVERLQIFFPTGSVGCGPTTDMRSGKVKLVCACMGGSNN